MSAERNIDWILNAASDPDHGSNRSRDIDAVDSSRFVHVPIKKNLVEAVIRIDVGQGPDEDCLELLRDVVERLTEAGYEVDMRVDTEKTPSNEIAGIPEDRILTLDRRMGKSVVLVDQGRELSRLAGKALIATGSAVENRFGRQDENDRWNRAQGRRHGAKRKGR